MHIRQADLYLREGEELSFYEILLRARQRREIVIGYRLANVERAVRFSLVCPDKFSDYMEKLNACLSLYFHIS